MSFGPQVDCTRSVIVSARANAGAPTDAAATIAPVACCRNCRRGAARARTSTPAAPVLECRKFILVQLLDAAPCLVLGSTYLSSARAMPRSDPRLPAARIAANGLLRRSEEADTHGE